MTGQRKFRVPIPVNPGFSAGLAVHPDGTIFSSVQDQHGVVIVVGIDGVTGAQKFSVRTSQPPYPTTGLSQMIIAGDGYAYAPYYYWESCGSGGPPCATNHLRLLRVSSAGAVNDIRIAEWQSPPPDLPMFASIITNADTGVLLTWSQWYGPQTASTPQMAITTGTSVSVMPGPGLTPMLQVEDGSFVGAGWDADGVQYMAAFDQTGNVHWTVSGDWPQMATDDDGVIAQSGAIYNRYGTFVRQLPSSPIQSWTGGLYRYGSVERIAGTPFGLAATFWAFAGANASGNQAASQPLPDRLKATYDIVKPDPLGGGAVLRNITYSLYQGIHLVPPAHQAVIKEHLLYSYGQKPQASSRIKQHFFCKLG